MQQQAITRPWPNVHHMPLLGLHELTHWGRETHICIIKLTLIGLDNGLSPGRHQAIIWTNAGILLIGPLVTIFREILMKIYSFLFKKMHLKMSSGKWLPFCLGLNVLTHSFQEIFCNIEFVWTLVQIMTILLVLSLVCLTQHIEVLNKKAAISQMTFWNVFSCMKMYEFHLRFHWSLFPMVQWTIS